MNRKNTLLVVCLAAFAAIGFCGCTTASAPVAPTLNPGAPPAISLPEVSIAGYGHVVAQLDFAHAAVALPLDPFSLGSPSYVMTVLQAIAVRTDECMASEGFPETARDADWSAYPAEDRTFGLWSVDYANRYGLELAAEGAPVQFYDISKYGAGYTEAHPTCMEQAKQSLVEPLAALDSQAMSGLDVQIRGSAAALVRASDGGIAALAGWQACMEGRGVTLDPDGRPSEQYKAQGREAVVEAIVVEAECAASSGAIQQLYDLQARYEAAYIDALADELAEFAAQRDAIAADLKAAIAGE